MRNFLFLLFCAFLIASCTSSKVYTRFSCKICLSKSDGVLLLPLAWDASFQRLSVAEQNELESQILTTLRDKGFSKAELYDRMDYELLSAGIKDLNDSTQRAKVNSTLGYPFLIGISLGDTKDTDGWDYQRPEEVNAIHQEYREPLEISATLRVALIETSTGEIVSDNTVFTEIREIGIPDKDGGREYWNFGTVSKAIRVATGKGVSFMVKDCGC